MILTAVGTATGYGLDGRGSIHGKSKGFFFFTVSRPVLGLTEPSIQWVPGAISCGVKCPGFEAVHSPPSSAEVKDGRSYNSTLVCVLMA
jgi:hypothetical protein